MARTVVIEFTNDGTFDEREIENVTALDIFPVKKNGSPSEFVKITTARGYVYIRRDLVTTIEDITEGPENPILTDIKEAGE